MNKEHHKGEHDDWVKECKTVVEHIAKKRRMFWKTVALQ